MAMGNGRWAIKCELRTVAVAATNLVVAVIGNCCRLRLQTAASICGCGSRITAADATKLVAAVLGCGLRLQTAASGYQTRITNCCCYCAAG